MAARGPKHLTKCSTSLPASLMTYATSCTTTRQHIIDLSGFCADLPTRVFRSWIASPPRHLKLPRIYNNNHLELAAALQRGPIFRDLEELIVPGFTGVNLKEELKSALFKVMKIVGTHHHI